MSSRMLTTTDNPFDPHSQFDEWNAYDMGKGYHTLSYLARVANYSNDLSQVDRERVIDEAIDEIVELNVLGIYTVSEKSEIK